MRTQDSVVAPRSALTSSPVVDSPLTRAWKGVRVDDIEVQRGSRASPPSALARVRMSLDLGVLLPADVDPELVIDGGSIESGPAVRRERMWCAYSYHNGHYDFAVDVPDSIVAEARRMSVTIRPGRAGLGAELAMAGVPAVTVEAFTHRSSP